MLTQVFQGCYSCVTWTLQGSYMGIIWMLKECYRGFTWVLQKFSMDVTEVLQGCNKGVTWILKGLYMCVTRVLEMCCAYGRRQISQSGRILGQIPQIYIYLLRGRFSKTLKGNQKIPHTGDTNSLDRCG